MPSTSWRRVASTREVVAIPNRFVGPEGRGRLAGPVARLGNAKVVPASLLVQRIPAAVLPGLASRAGQDAFDRVRELEFHTSAISVGSGQSIAEGQQVGRIGQTSHATGPHLHFEVWVGPIYEGYQVNPLKYF
jgi:peptidase M23-like protein